MRCQYEKRVLYSLCDLLGKRVRMRSGVIGPIMAIDIFHQIMVANENENGDYDYWFDELEIEEYL